MVAQLLDCFAVLFAAFVLRNPAAYFAWKPTSEDVDRIAEPTATMIARRPQLQNAVKRFAAPGMLAGGFSAYFMPRLFGLPRQGSPLGSSMEARQPRQEQAPASVVPTESTPAATANAAAAATEPAQREKIAPEQAARLGAAINGLLDNIRSGIPS